MRSIIINRTISFIKNNNDLNDEKLAIVKYGLESVYILITKTVFIILVSFLLGIVKATLWVLLFSALIRLFSFGVHASKSWVCLVISTIIFIGLPYLCTLGFMPTMYIHIVGIISVVLIYIYSPADTVKRPIKSIKRRIIYKFLSTVMALIYYSLAIYFRGTIISNYLMAALVIQSIVILPITYKAFGVPYANYKNSSLGHNQLKNNIF